VLSTLAVPSLHVRLKLQEEGTTLNVAHEDVSRREQVVGPSTDELHLRARIILRVDVEESNFLNVAAAWVLGDARDVANAETRAVVAVIRKAIVDVEVVVGALNLRLVVAGVLRSGKIAYVPNVHHTLPVGGGLNSINLIELVVGEEELLPGLIKQPALVSVGCTLVRRSRQDSRGVDTGVPVVTS